MSSASPAFSKRNSLLRSRVKVRVRVRVRVGVRVREKEVSALTFRGQAGSSELQPLTAG